MARLLRHAVTSPKAEIRETVEPFTGGLAARLPLSSEADVDAAFTMARRAQKQWALRPARERARVLLRFHDLVLDRQAEVLDLAQTETGKARRDAFEEIHDEHIGTRLRDVARRDRKFHAVVPLGLSCYRETQVSVAAVRTGAKKPGDSSWRIARRWL